MSFHAPNKYRIRSGEMCSSDDYGNNGAFRIPALGTRRPLPLFIIMSDGAGWKATGMPYPAWEHVSVSTAARCPTWEEMCLIKDLFWDEEDSVIQMHPPRSDYVNNHPYCLHLWRPIGIELPRPPSFAVGYKT